LDSFVVERDWHGTKAEGFDYVGRWIIDLYPMSSCFESAESYCRLESLGVVPTDVHHVRFYGLEGSL
jgi:hypothetical protein